MKKFLAVFAFFLSLICVLPEQNTIFAEVENIKITADSCYVYKTANTNLKLDSDDETNTNIWETTTFNTVFEVVGENGNFYEIKFTTSQNGFVLKAYCCDASLAPLTVKLDTNAVLTKISDIYFKVGNEFVKQSDTLESGTRVKLLTGSSDTNTYSQITVFHNDENLTCYVLSNNIEPDGINGQTVMAIFLIFTCTIIFLIIYAFYKNQQKKKKSV